MAAIRTSKRAGMIFDRCFESESPATEDINDRARVLAGGTVS